MLLLNKKSHAFPSNLLNYFNGVLGVAADELELTNFNSDVFYNTAGATNFYEVTLDENGLGAFKVGGDLTFDGTEVPGVYTGTFGVSVEYS